MINGFPASLNFVLQLLMKVKKRSPHSFMPHSSHLYPSTRTRAMTFHLHQSQLTWKWCQMKHCAWVHVWMRTSGRKELPFVHASERVLIKGGQASVVRPLTVPSLWMPNTTVQSTMQPSVDISALWTTSESLCVHLFLFRFQILSNTVKQ